MRTQRGYLDWAMVWFFAVIVMFLLVIFTVIWVMPPIACAKEAGLMELEHRYYRWTAGCVVKIDDRRFVNIDRVRIINGQISVVDSED